MSIVHFTAEIGHDQTIYPPADVQLAPGRADVTVVQAETAEPPCQDELFPPDVPNIAKSLASFADSRNTEGLPADLAINHDHYLHGAPRGIDQP